MTGTGVVMVCTSWLCLVLVGTGWLWFVLVGTVWSWVVVVGTAMVMVVVVVGSGVLSSGRPTGCFTHGKQPFTATQSPLPQR